MALITSIIWRGVIPILAFGFLSVSAFNYILLQVARTEPLSSIRGSCPTPFQGKSPYQLHYLSGVLPGVENLLCIVVAFFYPVIQPEQAVYSPWFTELMASLGICAVIPFIESSRAKNPFFLGVPVIMGLAYQTFTAAVIFPIFWLTLIIFGTTHTAADSQISQAKAEGVLAGVLLGYYLPTTAMMLYPTVVPIAIWQPFPLWMGIISTVYTLLRSNQAHQRSGYRTTQSVYIIILIFTTLARVSMLKSHGFSLQRVTDAWKPTWTPPASPEVTALDMIIHFFQWDGVFLLTSSGLASLWFARNIFQAIGILAWCAVAALTFGPGVALSAVFIWRESNLKSAREKLAAIKTKTK